MKKIKLTIIIGLTAFAILAQNSYADPGSDQFDPTTAQVPYKELPKFMRGIYSMTYDLGYCYKALLNYGDPFIKQKDIDKAGKKIKKLGGDFAYARYQAGIKDAEKKSYNPDHDEAPFDGDNKTEAQ